MLLMAEAEAEAEAGTSCQSPLLLLHYLTSIAITRPQKTICEYIIISMSNYIHPIYTSPTSYFLYSIFVIILGNSVSDQISLTCGLFLISYKIFPSRKTSSKSSMAAALSFPCALDTATKQFHLLSSVLSGIIACGIVSVPLQFSTLICLLPFPHLGFVLQAHFCPVK